MKRTMSSHCPLTTAGGTHSDKQQLLFHLSNILLALHPLPHILEFFTLCLWLSQWGFFSSSAGSRGFLWECFTAFNLFCGFSSLVLVVRIYLLTTLLYFFTCLWIWGKKGALLAVLPTKVSCSSVVRAGALQGCHDVHGCACWAGQLLVLCMMMVSVMCMTFSVGKWTVNTYSFFIGQITVLFLLSELPTPQKERP